MRPVDAGTTTICCLPGGAYIKDDEERKMLNFLRDLPKVELHAHLNGSLSISSLRDLGEKVYGKNTDEFLELCARFIKFDKNSNLEECFEKFAFVHELTSTEKGLRFATELAIRDFAKDNVQYVELRTTPKANSHYNRRDYLHYVVESIKNAQSKYPSIRVKLLASINRAEPVAVAEETVSLALEFAKIDPDIVVGVDLSGNPSRGEFRDFIPSLSMAKEQGLKLAIHCAEIENPSEIKEILAFGMSRCGHGTYLSNADRAHMKRHNIPVECCLTSNVKSGTVSSYEEHHLKQLMEAEAPKVLCTDDSGVFDTTLTMEFHLAYKTFGLTRSHCIELTKEAVHHSFASPEERRAMLLKVEEFLERNR